MVTAHLWTESLKKKKMPPSRPPLPYCSSLLNFVTVTSKLEATIMIRAEIVLKSAGLYDV